MGEVSVWSGYKTITPREISQIVYAFRAGRINYASVRVYFACLAAIAVREAAARVRKKGRLRSVSPRYCLKEISALTGLSEKITKRSFRKLSLLGFSFANPKLEIDVQDGTDAYFSGKRSPSRPIPVPRSVLRFVASCRKRSTALTLITYAARGLTIKREGGLIRGAGSVKASFVASATGLTARSVKAARKELIAVGLITKDTQSVQRKLNRDGAYFQWNFSWRPASGRRPPERFPFSPLPAKNDADFSPPLKEKKTPNGSKNQKARRPGLCRRKEGEGGVSLSDVNPGDLSDASKLRELFLQAVKRLWIKPGEASFLNFVGAAVRARRVNPASPGALFVALVRRNAWDFITASEEDTARRLIGERKETKEKIPVAPERVSLILAACGF